MVCREIGSIFQLTGIIFVCFSSQKDKPQLRQAEQRLRNLLYTYTSKYSIYYNQNKHMKLMSPAGSFAVWLFRRSNNNSYLNTTHLNKFFLTKIILFK